MKSKKSQGMALNVVIVAALVLIVLIVLVIIFSTRTKKFTEGTSEVEGQYSINRCEIPGTSRECVPVNAPCPPGKSPVAGLECPSNERCCQ